MSVTPRVQRIILICNFAKRAIPKSSQSFLSRLLFFQNGIEGFNELTSHLMDTLLQNISPGCFSFTSYANVYKDFSTGQGKGET